MIFPTSGNKTFEASDFADSFSHFSPLEVERLSLSHSVFREKNIAKHETNDIVFSLQLVFLFWHFDWRKIKRANN